MEVSNLTCSLIARYVLSCDVTKGGRRQRLSGMGFDATKVIPSFGRDQWLSGASISCNVTPPPSTYPCRASSSSRQILPAPLDALSISHERILHKNDFINRKAEPSPQENLARC